MRDIEKLKTIGFLSQFQIIESYQTLDVLLENYAVEMTKEQKTTPKELKK